MSASGQTIEILSRYIAGACTAALPAKVVEKTKHHILDTLAATVSGAELAPGKVIVPYIENLGGRAEAAVCGTDVVTNAVNASMANAMLAHADETDDSHFTSRSHLGCGVVPAAWAMAEREHAKGEAVVRAVALGYDIGARVCHALGTDQLYDAGHSTHTFAPTFGAAAAAGALAGLDAHQCRWLLSYTAQQASGVNCWQRDLDHVEKAFDFGGMAGRNGVAAATMVQAGFTGVDDVLSGPRNFLFAFSPDPRPEAFVEALGERFEIMHTNIKKWSVGSPIQAALDSMEALIAEHPEIAEHPVNADTIARIVVRMSDRESHVVDSREMPDINLQHMVALIAVDGTVSFASSHDEARFESDEQVAAMRRRVELTPDSDLPRRKPVLEVYLHDGTRLDHATPAVRGTPDNPMSAEEVARKARDLMVPVLGAAKTDQLIERVRALETVTDVRELRALTMI